MEFKNKSFLILVFLFLSGCTGKYWQAYEKPIQKGLTKFSTESELKEHIEVIKKYQEVANSNAPKPKKNNFGGYFLEEIVVTARKREDSGSITNNQEVDVDEGDIVKKIGDFLIVLRKGVLFSAYVGASNGTALELRSRVNVQENMKSHGSWYDELLVYQDHVIVIGYSYEVDASELVFFELSEYGELTYQWTYFLPSNDYFDNENYATRVVDGNLVLMVPTYESWSDLGERLNDGEHNQFIAKRHRDSYEELEEINIVSKRDYYKASSYIGQYFRTQNILQCPLENIQSAGLRCDVVSLLGVDGAFYVSPKAIYIWSSDRSAGFDYSQITLRDYAKLSRYGVLQKWESDQSENIIYRIDFNSGDVSGVAVQGAPINQFSFQEIQDQLLGITSYVNVTAERREREVYGVAIPISTFTSSIPDAPDDKYTFLAVADSYLSANRFLGENAFVSSFRYSEDKEMTDVIVWNTKTNRVSNFTSEYMIGAFHPLGDQMLAMGQNQNEQLILESWQIEPNPKSLSIKLFQDWIATESRSHGFNSSLLSGDLLFGVPVSQVFAKEAENKYWDDELTTDLVFFNYPSSGDFQQIGTIFGSKFQKEDSDCSVSCYDWYGSARPFFINGNIYALMDYELVRADYKSGMLEVRQRLNLQSGDIKFDW